MVGFASNPALKPANVQVEYTPEQIEEYKKCMADPVYFAKNYMTIVNLDAGRMKFDMYPFQEDLIHQFVKTRFNVAKLCRQCGKCLTAESILKIKNKKTGEIQEITIGDLYKNATTDGCGA